MMLPKVDSKGRMLIPQDIREELGIQLGDELSLEAENNVIVVKKMPGGSVV